MSENIDDRLSTLSDAKKALIQRLKSAKQGIGSGQVDLGIPKRANPQLPGILSFPQQRLWFLDQLEGPNATYNMPSAIELDGPLNVSALEQVFQELCQRHESLRTNFICIDGEPLQIIHQTGEIEIEKINLDNLNSVDQRSTYELIAKNFSQTTFNLAEDKLLHLKLVRFSNQRHILLLVIHHIISDGWSNGNVLLKEICALYRAFSEGKSSPLLPLSIQYADFAEWQRTSLNGSHLDKKVSYWSKKLTGIPALLDLPLDYVRPTKNTFLGKTAYFSIDTSILQGLKDLGRPYNASLFVVLLAAFSTLLYRYSRQETITVGSPIANRNTQELEGLIGFFVNTLVMRTDFTSNLTCIEIINQVRENFIESYPHQDLPFERLVEAIKPERNPSFSPLFQTMFILQNQNEERVGLKIGDLRLNVLPLAPETSMFDITLKLEEQDSELLGELEYNTDLFSENTMNNFIAHFQNVITSFIENPQQSVSSIPLLKSQEIKKIVEDFNQTEEIYPECENICTLFEQHAKNTPDRTAIIFGQEQITYGELNLRASQLASYLHQRGSGNEVLIGLCLDRSINLIIGILGILKSGGAYIPIDPAYPLNRIEGMIEAAKIDLILTESSVASILNAKSENLIQIDSDWDEIQSANTTNFLYTSPDQLIDRLAYVIFTSGSTGKPKGVQISHRALYNFLETMQDRPGLDQFDSLLAVTTISFDIAALEIYLPLITGARIILSNKETASDGFKLANLLFSTQATAMQATPATWRLLLSTINPKLIPLNKIICGGEALIGELSTTLVSTGAQVWNVYGPTETCIWSTRYLINHHNLKKNSNPSIGRPIANTFIYITDLLKQVMPIGIPGNLYIGGMGLSRGYLNQPGLTAERFIPSHFSSIPGERLYETGDVARLINNGDIEYIGRADFQVKVRGFRIELGEIESVLSQHPAIKNAVAACQITEEGNSTLNAFIETIDGWENLLSESQSRAEILDKWQIVWDKTYTPNELDTLPDQDLSGWISSYTGEPIPENQMLGWINETVKKVLALKPHCIMEIGSGSGLLLLRIAPKIQSYIGVDFSISSLETLQKRIQKVGLTNTKLICRNANEFTANEDNSFDTIILNSVSQYFPSIDYFLEFLEGAIRAVSNGGKIFIGDIRAKTMLELQSLSILAHQAKEDETLKDIRLRLKNRVAAEEELMIDPQFFALAKKKYPEIKGLTFLLKENNDFNEMNNFRYDLIISVQKNSANESEHSQPKIINADQEILSLDEIDFALKNYTKPLLIKNLTNKRTLHDTLLLDEIKNQANNESNLLVDTSLRAKNNFCFSVDPKELYELANINDLEIHLIWSDKDPIRKIDALFIKKEDLQNLRGDEAYFFSDTQDEAVGDLHKYASNPIASSKLQNLIRELFESLEVQLPSYMVPSNINLLEKIPLTPNGKIDRKALPKISGNIFNEQYIAPRNTQEETLYEIWSKLLNLKHIGINDNFFNLGGHSLLAVQVASKIRDHFFLEIPIQALFDNPTIALLANYLALQDGSNQKVGPPITPQIANQGIALPLSFSQKRLWFLDQLEGPSANYHISVSIEILGNIDLLALDHALINIVDRHTVLRTIYSDLNGQPSATITPTPNTLLEIKKIGSHSDHDEEIYHWLTEVNSKPFNLRSDIPIRASILEINENHFALTITVHHIASDEWSMVILQNELNQYYSAYIDQIQDPFPPLQIQYSDYAIWQQQWLNPEVIKAQLSYWSTQLRDAPTLLNLPLDKPRPSLQTHEGNTFEFLIDADLNKQLKKLCLETNTTLFMCLLACYGALLAKYANNGDVVIGTPITNRTRSELDGLIGFFVNTLPIRLQINPLMSTVDILALVRKTMLDAFANQDAPFESIVEAIHPERSLSHAPIFQTMFVLLNTLEEEVSNDNFKMLPLKAEVTKAKFDLTLSFAELSGALQGSFEYNLDLFEEHTIEQLSRHFTNLLRSMVETPSAPFLPSPLLTNDERKKLLLDFNPTSYSNNPIAIEKLFELQASIQPDAIAITWQNCSLTYSELNKEANKLAHALRNLNVNNDSVIGLFFEPSLEMIISMLGALKAGCAYLPILPSAPLDRMMDMVNESNAQFILCSRKCQPNSINNFKTYFIENLLEDNTLNHNPDWINLEDSLAYVIYTSGSTGNPKGVGISRSNLAYYLQSRLHFYSEKVNGLLLLQPYGFDIATGNIFWTLCQGGTLYIEAKELAGEPHALLQRIANTQISHLVLLPLLHKSLLELIDPGSLAALKHVTLGGESLSADLARDHYLKLPKVRLTNEYGPTETTIMCTAYNVSESHETDNIPIGMPTCNARIHLLDSFLDLSFPNVGGEITIGGPQVSRGYLNQPKLTAEKFVPNPFSITPGGRAYKSGDFARYTKDGQLLFQGRKDKQVKIRGFRIELSEIENALLNLNVIKNACVIVIGNASSARIYAYLVPDPQHTVSSAEIYSSLQKVLPDYMLPSGIDFIPELPFTANGKLDFNALPPPKFEDDSVSYTAPRNDTEKILCKVWEDVLGISTVGIHDNFFNLGGDSILSIQIISRANQSGLTLSVKQLFQQQTIAKLASITQVTNKVQAPQGILSGSYSLGPIQHWFFEKFQIDPNHFNQSVFLEVDSSLTLKNLQLAFEYLITHHDILRSKFRIDSAKPSNSTAFIETDHHSVAYDFHDLSLLSEFDQENEINSISSMLQSSLSIEKGALLRVALFDIAIGKPKKLLIISHHLVIDGISWRILLSDLDTLLDQLTQNLSLRLQAKTSSFAQWTSSLVEYAQTSAVTNDLEYWLKQREKRAPFPTDFPYDVLKNDWGSLTNIEVSLNPTLSRALLMDVPRIYRTQINDVLLSALVISLNKWTNLQDFEITMEGHGREDLFDDIDISRTIGWFTSSYPLHLHHQDGEAIESTILRIKNQLRKLPHNGITYGLLHYLNSEEKTQVLRDNDTPSPISFNYLGQLDQSSQGKFFLGEANGNVGPDYSQHGLRQALIDINSRISNGQFILNLSFSKNLHKSESIETFGNLYLGVLSNIVENCGNETLNSYSEHDFPLVDLSAESYEALFTKYQKDVEDIYPLSPMQEGMIFHSRFSANSGAYIIQMSCVMSGNFSPEKFQHAWLSVINRHPSLRTTIYENIQSPDYQIVLKKVVPSWQFLDWSNLSEDDQKLQWEQLLSSDRSEGYVLDLPSLMRFYLIRFSENEWRFLWSHHHLLTDGWCLPILMREVLHFYSNPAVIDLPLPAPYRLYIEWLGLQNIDEAKEYWTKQLAGFSAPTPLGLLNSDQQNNQAANSSYKEIGTLLSAELSATLSDYAKRNRLTLSNLMQGTWAILLGIYSQNTDIVFGVTVSGRPPELRGVEDMIGLFINSLPVRVQINPAKKIQQFLVELMENQVENDHYSYTPLVTIHGCSNVPSRLPLFNSILVFENYPLDATIDEQAEKLSIRNLQIHEQTNFPLTITASGGKQIPIKISFDESIIAIENIELMGVHFENLLRYLCRHPDATISEWMANALTPNESFQLVETLNESSQLFIEDQYTLPDLFELQAKMHEDKVALCMGQDYLTYDELNKRANQLARNLQNLGAEPGDLIGVCLNRSPLLIISLLAIQKLGAAYLPIDPDYPSQRIAYMLEDAQVRILLNDSHSHKDIVSTIPNCQLLEIDLEALDKLSAENIEIKRSPLAPAYVIYTSGSTGNPKGVQISQSALVNFLLSMRERPGMNLNDKLLSVTTISFDIAGLEIYLPLIVGGQIILVDRDVSSDGSTLLTTIQNSGATIMQATPVTWRLLYEAGWDGIGLEQVWCGGEAFPLDLATKLKNTNAVVWNLYGPTETTIWSTRFLLSSNQELKNNVPIGRPISNTQLFILDKQRNLLPKVVAGELFIGGNGLANCYLNRPSLTAEKFTPNPFSESRGSRLYATGDIARYQTDGNLICMGRIDQQIKLRGFRIELGEIEACLQNYEEIKQVVVQVVELAKDDQRLVAYLSVHNDALFEVGNVQNWLRNQLPHHLIPSEWMVLDNFPLTPNGKLDKKALPHPTRPTNIDYIGPASPTEEILEKLMSEVLNLKQVSSNADFFDLGGHSLLATKLAARIKQQFDLNISLPILFERANIKQLGEYIDNLQWTSQNNSEVSSPLNDEEEEFKL